MAQSKRYWGFNFADKGLSLTGVVLKYSLFYIYFSTRKTDRRTCHAQHEFLRFQRLIWQNEINGPLKPFQSESNRLRKSKGEEKICERRERNIQTTQLHLYWKFPSTIARLDHSFVCWARCFKSSKTVDWKASKIQRKIIASTSKHFHDTKHLEEDHICDRELKQPATAKWQVSEYEKNRRNRYTDELRLHKNIWRKKNRRQKTVNSYQENLGNFIHVKRKTVKKC